MYIVGKYKIYLYEL